MQHGLADLLSQCLPGRGQLDEDGAAANEVQAGSQAHGVLPAARRRGGSANRAQLVRRAALRQHDAADIAGRGGTIASWLHHSHASRARTTSGQTGLLIAPIDPQMPQLMRLNDRSYVIGHAREPDARIRPCCRTQQRIQAVRYRPGQRHVLHVSPASDRDGSAMFIKIDRDDCGARAVRFAQAVGPLLSERCPTASLVPAARLLRRGPGCRMAWTLPARRCRRKCATPLEPPRCSRCSARRSASCTTWTARLRAR